MLANLPDRKTCHLGKIVIDYERGWYGIVVSPDAKNLPNHLWFEWYCFQTKEKHRAHLLDTINITDRTIEFRR